MFFFSSDFLWCILGAIYVSKSDFTKALEYYNKSLKIYEVQVPNTVHIGGILSHLANCYDAKGDLPKAVEIY